MSYRIGDRIVFTPRSGGPRMGKVRWSGEIKGKPLIGIEFDQDGQGKHNGFLAETGQQLFTCPKGRGAFIQPTSPSLTKVDAHDELATSMRGSARAISIGLESMDEDRVLSHASAVTRAEKEMSTAFKGDCYRQLWDPQAERYVYVDRSNPRQPLSRLPAGATVSSIEGGPDSTDRLPATWDGPRFHRLHQCVVEPREAKALLKFLQERWQELLPAELLYGLARGGRELFKANKTVQDVMVPPDGKLVVVGDTHGHLKDFLHLIRMEGPPSEKVTYVFNGDICDRSDHEARGGANALHIWAGVLAFKMCYPKHVFMNRGNHEDALYWKQYGAAGFAGEIESKYKPKEASRLIDAFSDICEALPLAHVISKKVLVVHGGLPRIWEGASACRLSEIEKIPRPLTMPCRPTNRKEHIVYDIAWADPQEARGVGANDRGGSIISYGPDVTKKFLAAEGLSMMIRSHEVPGRQQAFEGRGFEWWHPVGMERMVKGSGPTPLGPQQKGWCLTVFSASDYCGYTDENSGAHVVFHKGPKDFEIKEHAGFEAEDTLLSFGAEGDMGESQRNPELVAEQQLWGALQLRRALVEVIIRNKHTLLAEFTAADTNRDWHLPVEDFIDCASRCLPRVPWEKVCLDSSLVPQQAGVVNYTSFLTRYQLRFRNTLGKHAGFRRALTDRLFESLLRADRSMRDTFELIDTDGDGVVSVEEFGNALAHHGKMLNAEQAQALYRTTINTEGGNVKVEDFLGGLSMRFALSHAKAAVGEDSFIPALLDSIGREIIEGQSAVPGCGGYSVPVLLRYFFERSDMNKNGHLESEEFLNAIRQLGCCRNLRESQLNRVVQYIDHDGNGSINYLELLSALNVSHGDSDSKREGPKHLIEDVLEAVYRVLHFEYRNPLRTLLQRAVKPGSTRCSSQLFASALTTLNRGNPSSLLTEQQIDCLVGTLDVDRLRGEGSASFDFEDWFDSFEIVDTVGGEEDDLVK